MKYLQVKESFPSKHNLVFTEGTREWFLDNNNVTSAARVWRRLASLRFHRGSNMPPIVSIPEIDIENYCGSCFDFYYAMPDGKLIDFFTLGINFFVSSELKELLEKERVEALFSQARVLINGQEYSSKYYLMAPLDMLDVFDATESTYVCEIDSEGDEYIVSVDNLVLSKKINSDRKVFFIFVSNALDILVFRSDIAKKITEKGFRGMGFLPVFNMKDS